MPRFGIGALLLLATSCSAAPPTPPPAPNVVATACTFGDVRSCMARCETGSAESCNAAGAHFELGAGVPRDLDVAAKYYVRACSAGAATACENRERVRAAKVEATVVAPRVEPPAPPPPAPVVADQDAGTEAPTFGTFASTGGMLGTWTSTAGHCFSGASESSLGALSWAIVDDAARTGDYSLQIGATSGKVDSIGLLRSHPYRSVDVERSKCLLFDAKLRADDGKMTADVEIDCATPDGGRVQASIHGAACGDL